MVESQQQIATSSLVDDLAEQALLEELIERSKPPLRSGTERLHYLLATPFRYPPLRHGSRFGGRFEPSLLYGAAWLRLYWPRSPTIASCFGPVWRYPRRHAGF
jgi:hypothetical protein